MGVEKQLLIFSSCLSPGPIKKLNTFIYFCLKFGNSATVKHSKSAWEQRIFLWKVQNQNIKSSGHNARSALLDRGRGTIDLRQLSLTVVVLISGAFVRSRLITNGVYIGVIHLHIAMPTITCFRLTLRVIHKLKRTSQGQFQHSGMVYALNLWTRG